MIEQEDEGRAADAAEAAGAAEATEAGDSASGEAAGEEAGGQVEGGEGVEEERALGDGEPVVEMHAHRIVEAILFAADAPMPAAKIATVLGVGTGRDAKKHIAALNEEYAGWGLSFRIEEIAGGFQMLTQPAYNTWLSKLLRTRQETKLSPAAMETLAIVAYKQPCTRADIEVVRGVAAGDMLNRLREMNLVKIVGRAEDLGRPLLYGTSKRFLEVFGLPSLEDLPQVEALAGGAGVMAVGHTMADVSEATEAAPADETPTDDGQTTSIDFTADADADADESPGEERSDDASVDPDQ